MKKPPKFRESITLIHELAASPTEPMPVALWQRSVNAIQAGIGSMERDERPGLESWRAVSDAVNILESLVELGYAEDSTGLLQDCMKSMGAAGRRYMEGQRLGLDGQGVRNLRALLDSYAEIIGAVSHRQFVKAVRRTHRRVWEIHYGVKKAKTDEVVCL